MYSSKDSALSWALDHVPLKSAPGDRSKFSEFAYFVLGRVIEKMSGMSYKNFVKENILQPAGITDMELCWDSAGRPHEVSYYFPSPDAIEDFFRQRSNGKIQENLYLSRGDAAFGWIASSTDIVKLMIKYRNLNSLNGNVINSKKTTSTDTAKADDGYSFDWCSVD